MPNQLGSKKFFNSKTCDRICLKRCFVLYVKCHAVFSITWLVKIPISEVVSVDTELPEFYNECRQ